MAGIFSGDLFSVGGGLGQAADMTITQAEADAAAARASGGGKSASGGAYMPGSTPSTAGGKAGAATYMPGAPALDTTAYAPPVAADNTMLYVGGAVVAVAAVAAVFLLSGNRRGTVTANRGRRGRRSRSRRGR